ncbi:SDR family NAD(P)-dependent oxidoreductase [Pseudonocardia bannensis]|uniref:SDR family NAD(P)-dependent oxidoreductase n=1 Tax=Pseudonocardia bannensis TaxID=630973 RepID=A0A848DPX2_9PSEU|nr:SDR family NAD(P)-dependent oxidoreductase [Pseudonocardia bannensis]NMH94573.1 SDR family NAD(P)-dependent oxidoreductase [Pseudonocardia bannensis]
MVSAVVVTGAAGALGRAVLSELRARGVKTVVALDRPSAALDEVGRAEGVHAIAVDLADRDAVRAAWERIDEIDGATPDALVAVAGGFVPGTLADLDETTIDGLWHTNVGSLLWCAQAAASRMASSGGGSIVTVGSKTAVSGRAPVAHAATKAAVVRVTELLADELRGSGIRVNAVLPSVIDTPANRTWMSDDLAARAVPPAAIAKVIAFLIGDDAWPISGAKIPVYGDA